MRSIPLIIGLALIAMPCSSAFGQDDPPRPSTAQIRRDALNWLDRYLIEQVLFLPEDAKKFRDKVERMSATELDAWVYETNELRASLESDEWKQTRQWLRDFLKVQAIYSDEEIEQLRRDAAEKTPSELIEMMHKIKQKHDTLRFMHSSSQTSRAAAMKTRTALQQQTAAAPRKISRSSRPLYGSAQASAAKKHQTRYSVPPPLIDSRSVAREAVQRSIFPYRRGW